MAGTVRPPTFLPLVDGPDEAHHQGMFSAHCNAEGREVLLTTRRITSVEMADGVTRIGFTCWCGHDGVVVDRSISRPAAAPVPAPHRAA